MDDATASLPADTRISANEALMQLIRNIYERDVSKYSATLKIANPFDIDAIGLSEIREITLKALHLLHPDSQIKFLGLVGFSNGQTQRYDDYDLLLQVSSNSAIPAYLELKWAIFEVGQDIFPIAGELTFRLATEKAELEEVQTTSSSKKAFVEFCVTSSNERWARQTFGEIQPFIQPMLYGKALTFLIRLNHEVTHFVISLIIIGPLLFTLISSFFGNLPGERDWNSIQYNEIVSTNSIGSKIDLLAKALLQKEEPDSWRVIVTIAGSVLTLFGVAFLVGKALDRLIPSSAIIMGASGKILSKNRARNRFIWGVVIIPILIALLTGVGIGIYFG